MFNLFNSLKQNYKFKFNLTILKFQKLSYSTLNLTTATATTSAKDSNINRATQIGSFATQQLASINGAVSTVIFGRRRSGDASNNINTNKNHARHQSTKANGNQTNSKGKWLNL